MRSVANQWPESKAQMHVVASLASGGQPSNPLPEVDDMDIDEQWEIDGLNDGMDRVSAL